MRRSQACAACTALEVPRSPADRPQAGTPGGGGAAAAAAMAPRASELALVRQQLAQLTADFKFNLRLLEERDLELGRLEAVLAGLREAAAAKELVGGGRWVPAERVLGGGWRPGQGMPLQTASFPCVKSLPVLPFEAGREGEGRRGLPAHCPRRPSPRPSGCWGSATLRCGKRRRGWRRWRSATARPWSSASARSRTPGAPGSRGPARRRGGPGRAERLLQRRVLGAGAGGLRMH